MKYNLAFKYRIYPNKEQKLLINKTFGCVRFVYNTILYTANKIYSQCTKSYCKQNEYIQKSYLSTILAPYLDKFCIWMLNYIS